MSFLEEGFSIYDQHHEYHPSHVPLGNRKTVSWWSSDLPDQISPPPPPTPLATIPPHPKASQSVDSHL